MTTTLVTPAFVGDDEEKIRALGYWSGLISMLRSPSLSEFSPENKLAILQQLKCEIDQMTPTVPPLQAPLNPPVPICPTEQPVVDLSFPQYESREIPIAEQMQRLAGNWYKK
jgi:hypothetical protein